MERGKLAIPPPWAQGVVSSNLTAPTKHNGQILWQNRGNVPSVPGFPTSNSPGKWRWRMRVKPVEAVEPPPLTPEQFRETPEFRKFKGIMRKILKVPKVELDHRGQIGRTSC